LRGPPDTDAIFDMFICNITETLQGDETDYMCFRKENFADSKPLLFLTLTYEVCAENDLSLTD